MGVGEEARKPQQRAQRAAGYLHMEPSVGEADVDGEIPRISQGVKSNPGFGEARRSRILKYAGCATALVVVACAAPAAVGALRQNAHVAATVAKLVAHVHRATRHSGPCSYERDGTCPAIGLLASPKVHEAATDTLLQAGRFFLGPEDAAFVHATVVAGFANMTARLAQRAPGVLGRLAELRITERQQAVALSCLRLLASARIQSVGREVAMAIREAPSAARDDVRRAVQERMEPHAAILRDLRDELEPLLRYWSMEGKWDMALDDESIHLLQQFQGGEFVSVAPQDMVSMQGIADAPITPAQLSYVLLGGALEEGRALLHIVNFISLNPGEDLKVPTWATAMIDVVDLDPALLSCEVDPAPRTGSRVRLTQALYCPLKFGVLGLEAVRATTPSDLLAPPAAYGALQG